MNPVHHVSWPIVAQETLLHIDFFDVNSSPLDFELGRDELRKWNTPNLVMSGASTIKPERCPAPTCPGVVFNIGYCLNELLNGLLDVCLFVKDGLPFKTIHTLFLFPVESWNTSGSYKSSLINSWADAESVITPRYRKLVLGTGSADVHVRSAPRDSLPLLGTVSGVIQLMVQFLHFLKERPCGGYLWNVEILSWFFL